MPYAYSNRNWFRTGVTLSKTARYPETTYIAAGCVALLLMADMELNPKRYKLCSRLQRHRNTEINHNSGLVDCIKQFQFPRIVI